MHFFDVDRFVGSWEEADHGVKASVDLSIDGSTVVEVDSFTLETGCRNLGGKMTWCGRNDLFNYSWFKGRHDYGHDNHIILKGVTLFDRHLVDRLELRDDSGYWGHDNHLSVEYKGGAQLPAFINISTRGGIQGDLSLDVPSFNAYFVDVDHLSVNVKGVVDGVKLSGDLIVDGSTVLEIDSLRVETGCWSYEGVSPNCYCWNHRNERVAA